MSDPQPAAEPVSAGDTLDTVASGGDGDGAPNPGVAQTVPDEGTLTEDPDAVDPDTDEQIVAVTSGHGPFAGMAHLALVVEQDGVKVAERAWHWSGQEVPRTIRAALDGLFDTSEAATLRFTLGGEKDGDRKTIATAEVEHTPKAD